VVYLFEVRLDKYVNNVLSGGTQGRVTRGCKATQDVDKNIVGRNRIGH